MKEFDMNNGGINEQNNENNVNTDARNNTPEQSNADNTQNVNNSSSSVPENHRVETPYSGNPYFEGFGKNQNDAYRSENSQSNKQSGYSQYQQGGSYNQNHTYNAPQQNGGQISYSPEKTKKEKKSKPVTKGALAAVAAVTILLSGVVGYCGAFLATGKTTTVEHSVTEVTQNTGNTSSVNSGGNVVIYRNVDDVTTSTGADGNYTTAQVASMVKDSVVEINTEFTSTTRGWYNYVQTGAGSGVIITTDGFIITNAHVITDDDTSSVADSITVRLTNGEEYPATVVGYDSEADIAIIKVEAEGLTAAQCGDSDNLAVGEELIIVGNPLGELGGTVTNGIVSATEREIDVNGVKMNLIQTNAAVNPGNSGGGMFNMKGQLVGVVNAKSSGTGIEGLGFAIPVNEALNVAQQLLEYGYVRGKTMIGVTFSEVSSNSFYFYYNIKAGVYVDSLTEGYNDDVLQPGDRVVAVNGDTVSSTSEIKAIVTAASVGDKLKFQVERNGKLMEVEVECFEKVPENGTSIEFSEDSNSELNGIFGNN